MNILVINSGSASQKTDLLEVSDSDSDSPKRLASGRIVRFGDAAEIEFTITGGRSLKTQRRIRNHSEGVEALLAWLDTNSGAGQGSNVKIDAVGHRIVHGGFRFRETTLIDENVLADLGRLNDLAPLHNPPALEALRAAWKLLGKTVPMVAVFDTAFHRTLPEYAACYPIRHEVAERHGIRRYGFHGIAHEYMLRRYAALTRTPIEQAAVITFQLGGGCSATAVRNGQSVDTSMGFTPMEGLMMGTRAGDLDPGLVTYLARNAPFSTAELDRWLNEQCGLFGVSDRSGNMRELLEAAATDQRAALAVEMFCYRAKKYLGAYLAALGGAQAVIFGGGIGENAPTIRAKICAGMEWCGIRLDHRKNEAAVGAEERVSRPDSMLEIWAIPVAEATLIAEEVLKVAGGLRPATRQGISAAPILGE